MLWIFDVAGSGPGDPHGADYDLSVLVMAGVFACYFIPGLRWAIVLLYVLALLRVQVPIGVGELQLTTLWLGCVTFLVWRLTAAGLAATSQLP